MFSDLTTLRKWRKFSGAENGSVAVEFGLVGFIFVAGILFVFQLAFDLVLSRALDEAVRAAGRIVMINKPQSQSAFLALFKGKATRFVDKNQIVFNVTDVTTLLPSINSPPTIGGRVVGKKVVSQPVPQQYPAQLVSGAIVLIEAFYPVPWFYPVKLAGVETFGSRTVRWRSSISVGAVE